MHQINKILKIFNLCIVKLNKIDKEHWVYQVIRALVLNGDIVESNANFSMKLKAINCKSSIRINRSVFTIFVTA